MFGKMRKIPRISTLIGANVEIIGDLVFTGGLHVDGTVKGNISAERDAAATIIVSETGVVEGDIDATNIILNGTVVGDVRAWEKVELAAAAKVTGTVYYRLLEMSMGAAVNGQLVHVEDKARSETKRQDASPPASLPSVQQAADVALAMASKDPPTSTSAATVPPAPEAAADNT